MLVKNKEKIKLYNKKWELNNPNYFKDYYLKNKSSILIKHKNYIKNNREKYNKQHNKYRKLKYLNQSNALLRKWRKKNPEKNNQYNIKYLQKQSNLINLNFKKYKFLLLSWSKSIRKRDNHTCQICGIRDEKLNIAHHLLHKAKYPQLSLNINNGITLCKKCHKNVHIK